MMIKKRGMREIQAKKERPNFGAEKAVKTPLATASPISIILSFKIETAELDAIPAIFHRERSVQLPGA